MDAVIEWGLRIAGAGEIALGLLGFVAKREMNWHEELSRLSPMNARMYRTVYGYVSGANMCMGTLALLAPSLLLDGSTLATLVAAFIAAWWTVRLALQLFWYRWREAPGIVGALLSRALLMLGFTGFAAAHWLAVLHNLGALGG